MSRISLLIPVLLLAACGSTKLGSGFLDDDIYAQMKEGQHEGSHFWIKEGADLRAYDRLLIRPVEVIDGADKSKQLSDEQKKLAREAFRRILIEEVGPYYPVVEEPGDHVLVVRIALTELTPIEDGMHAGAAALEVDFRDAKTDEILCAGISRVTGTTKARGLAKDPKWAAVESAFFEWADRLLTFMDSYHQGE